MTDRHLRFVAIADHQMPHGPLPGFDGATMVQSPQGDLPLGRVKPGQLLLAADGRTAQVRWLGQVTLPARGRFAPQLLAAPYHGARRDLICAAHARIHLTGSAVDYLFATETVSVCAGDLTEGVTPRRTGLLARWHQIMLDRPVALRSGGLLVEPLDVAPLVADASLRQDSVLATLPAEFLPVSTTRRMPRLGGAEAQALGALRAA